MKRSCQCSIKIAGVHIDVTYLGEGRFSTAYRDIIFPEKVYIRTRQRDPGKEILSRFTSQPHLPRLNVLEDSDSIIWYESDYSHDLSASKKEAWQQAKLLMQIHSDTGMRCASRICLNQFPLSQLKPQMQAEFMDHLGTLELPDDLKYAIEQLDYWMRSYSDQAMFDFSRRNFGVSSEGLLILRNVVCVS